MIKIILVTVLVTYASGKSFSDGNINGLEQANPNLGDYAQYLRSLRNTTCTEIGQYYCEDCLTPAHCNGDGLALLLETCTSGLACTEGVGFSYCAYDTGSAKCECGSTPKMCDSYDQDSVMYCDSDGPFWIEPCADGETCSSGKCVEILEPTTPKPPVCTDGYTGLILVAPTCEDAYYCNNGTELSHTTCATGEYYDPNLGCQTAPPKACLENCLGYCLDPVDCTKFYICDGEGNVMTNGVCEDGQLFNNEASPPQCEDFSGGELPDYCPKTVVCTDYLY